MDVRWAGSCGRPAPSGLREREPAQASDADEAEGAAEQDALPRAGEPPAVEAATRRHGRQHRDPLESRQQASECSAGSGLLEGEPAHEHPVEEALGRRRHGHPPGREDEHEVVGRCQSVLVVDHLRIDRRPETPGSEVARVERGVESLGRQVDDVDGMTGGLEAGSCVCEQRGRETASVRDVIGRIGAVWVVEDDQGVHEDLNQLQTELSH